MGDLAPIFAAEFGNLAHQGLAADGGIEVSALAVIYMRDMDVDRPGKRVEPEAILGRSKRLDQRFAVIGGKVIRCLERSEEHTSELQSLMRISYAVFCLKKKNIKILNDRILSQLHATTIHAI